jgi:hypothetical protein
MMRFAVRILEKFLGVTTCSRQRKKVSQWNDENEIVSKKRGKKEQALWKTGYIVTHTSHYARHRATLPSKNNTPTPAIIRFPTSEPG